MLVALIPPSCWQASSNQLKVLSEKTEVPQRKDCAPKLMLDSGMHYQLFSGSLVCQPALQIFDFMFV